MGSRRGRRSSVVAFEGFDFSHVDLRNLEVVIPEMSF